MLRKIPWELWRIRASLAFPIVSKHANSLPLGYFNVPTRRVLLLLSAGLSFVAAAIHLAVAPAHFEEWWGYGVFFLGAASAQIALGLLLVARPARAIFILGATGNLLIVAIYVITRTIGIPFFGPKAGEVEGIGFVDLISKVAEIILVAILIGLWARSSRVPEVSQVPAAEEPMGNPRAPPRLYGAALL